MSLLQIVAVQIEISRGTFGKLCRKWTVLCLDPLPRWVDEADQSGRAAADLRRKFGDFVESGFRKRVEDGIACQRVQGVRARWLGSSAFMTSPRAT